MSAPAVLAETATPTDRHRSGWAFTALLVLTQLPAVFSYTIPLPLLAAMARELALDPGSAYLAKMVSGVLGPAMAIGAASGGWLADKFDRRWLVMAIGTAYVVSAIAPALLEHLGWIVVARACTGTAAGALMTIGLTMVGDYLPPVKRAGTIGMLSAVNMIGSVVTLPVAGTIGDAGWRHAFLLYLLAAPVILLASPRALPVPHKSPAPAGQVVSASNWFTGLPWALLVLAFGIGVILTIPGIYVSFHLATIGLGRSSTVGFLMMVNSFVAAGSASLFGRVWQWSPRAVFCLGFATTAIGLALLAMASGHLQPLGALVLMGIGMGFLAPSLMARAANTVEEGKRGRVLGILQATTAIAPLICISLLEPFTPVIGTRGIMLAICALSVLYFAGYAVSRDSSRKPALD